jgi:hypothetical protein
MLIYVRNEYTRKKTQRNQEEAMELMYETKFVTEVRNI